VAAHDPLDVPMLVDRTGRVTTLSKDLQPE